MSYEEELKSWSLEFARGVLHGLEESTWAVNDDDGWWVHEGRIRDLKEDLAKLQQEPSAPIDKVQEEWVSLSKHQRDFIFNLLSSNGVLSPPLITEEWEAIHTSIRLLKVLGS